MAASKWRVRVGQPAIPGIDTTLLSTANTNWIAPQFGDDRNAGTEDAPLASFGRSQVIGKTYRAFTGYSFNEGSLTETSKTYIGDGFARLQSNLLPLIPFNSNTNTYFNILQTGFNGSAINSTYTRCKILTRTATYGAIEGSTGNNRLNSIIFKGITGQGPLMWTNGSGSKRNRTYIILQGVTATVTGPDPITTFWVNCLIAGRGVFNVNNNLAAKSIFYSYIVNNTPILLNGGSGTNETVATTASSISALRTRAAAVYGGSPADYFPNCYVGPNPFNETDPAMIESVDGDHTLNSIMGAGLMAATMADNFGFVGAYNIATRWGVGDFTTLTNLSIVGNDYQLTNPLSDGSAIGKIKSFGRIRDIQRNLFSGSEAPLNGIVLDSTQDQGAPIAPSGTTYSGLLNPASYVVSQGAGVTYNGIVYTQGQKFTTVAGVTTATDNDGLGRIREIIERPNKKNVQWRFSQGGAVSSNINTFTNNSWLTVLQGSINDGTFTYNVGDFLLYNNALTYSGTYSLQFVFLESEPFKNFEISNANNFSVDGSGTANGEQAFNYGTEVSFRARYGQPKLIIEADNQRFLI